MELCLQTSPHLLKGDLKEIEPVDAIYLGEIYCPKKELPLDELVILSRKLKGMGKKVYFSTPVLAVGNGILSRIRDYFQMAKEGIADGVNVNDLGALRIGVREFPKVSLYAGPYLEVRNVTSAKVLTNLGVERFSLPYDLPSDEITRIAKEISVEIFVQGNIPLLVSRRCFLMRAKGMREDNFCHNMCLNDFKEGMKIAPCGSKEPLFELKGKVVYSTKEYSLLEHWDQIKEMGMVAILFEENGHLRPDIYQAYRELLDGKTSYQSPVTTRQYVNGFFFGQVGLEYVGKDRGQRAEVRGKKSEDRAQKTEGRGQKKSNYRSPITNHQINGQLFEELSNLAKKVEQSEKLKDKLKGIDGDVLFEVTDTGEKYLLGVREGKPYGPIAGETEMAPSLWVRAKEDIFLRLIKGDLDPDAAYLLRKIRFKGPFFGAVKLKHILEGLGAI